MAVVSPDDWRAICECVEDTYSVCLRHETTDCFVVEPANHFTLDTYSHAIPALQADAAALVAALLDDADEASP